MPDNTIGPRIPDTTYKPDKTGQASIEIMKGPNNNEMVVLIKNPDSYCFDKKTGDFLCKPDRESEPRRMSPDEIKDFIKPVRTKYGEPLAQEMEKSFKKNYRGCRVLIEVLNKDGQMVYEDTKNHTQDVTPRSTLWPFIRTGPFTPQIYMPQETDENGNGKNYRWEPDYKKLDAEEQKCMDSKYNYKK